MIHVPSSLQPKDKRLKNFREVCLGLAKKTALDEAQRCPQCTYKDCVPGCPLGVEIPDFIRRLREGNVKGALEIILEENDLPGICGRLCRAPCERACVLDNDDSAIRIRLLERYTADHGRVKVSPKILPGTKPKKVGIIGSGPAGLTAAARLARQGYAVTLFESQPECGGILRYGIPEFRLPRKILREEISRILALGVKAVTGCVIGRTLTYEDLKKDGYAALLLACGQGRVVPGADLPGTGLGGVCYAEELLFSRAVAGTSSMEPPFPLGRKVAVLGSGYPALDCARMAARFGCEVTVVFPDTEEDMRVPLGLRHQAREENIRFSVLTEVLGLEGDARHLVKGVQCRQMDYADPDASGEWQLVPVPGSEFVMEADTVVLAGAGQAVFQAPESFPTLKTGRDGNLKLNAKTGMTSVPGLFAAGGIIGRGGGIIEAMASGKQAAEWIGGFINRK